MASDRWTNGSTRQWKKLRARVLERDGNRCTHVDEHGLRCDKTERLEVHHEKPGAAIDADIDDLRTVCKKHHPKPDAAWKEDTAAAVAEAAISKLEIQEIDIRLLMPAVWNANKVRRETLEKIKNSFRQFGVVENSVVRPHPEFPGKYEILSGNHRLQIYKQLRIKTVPCQVLDLDDGLARVLAQTLNRTRGTDDPEKLAALMDEITMALPKSRVDDFLHDVATLPRGLDGKAMTRLLGHQKDNTGAGYEFKPIHPMKLGHRLEACCHPRRMEKALELFAGHGQLTYWYARLFPKLVRVDIDQTGNPDHVMGAAEYLRGPFVDDGPFDLIDLDDEGSPHEELDALFEVLKQHPQPPFVLCVTDGLAHRLKLIRKLPTDLMKIYRWPEKEAKGKQIYLRCPELLDHGVKARAEEAGYVAETIAVDWKPGKAATFGSWIIGPEEDTRNEIERELEGDTVPEAWGTWRIRLK